MPYFQRIAKDLHRRVDPLEHQHAGQASARHGRGKDEPEHSPAGGGAQAEETPDESQPRFGNFKSAIEQRPSAQVVDDARSPSTNTPLVTTDHADGAPMWTKPGAVDQTYQDCVGHPTIEM